MVGRQAVLNPRLCPQPIVARIVLEFDCAAYAQGLRVATVEIADISEELKHEDRFVGLGVSLTRSWGDSGKWPTTWP
jgi:hypothetical protein